MNRIDVTIGATPTHDVSPDLWGIFLEDLNYALDGGLNADLVANGDFEFTQADGPHWGPLTSWSVETPRAGRTVWPREAAPIHPANAVHVRVEGPTTLRNDGWDGVPVTAGRTYRLRFAARLVDGPGIVECGVASRRENLTTTAQVALAVAGSAADDAGWTWFETDLPAVSSGNGQLELRVADGDVVELDCVSLRPIGDDGQPELFRRDLLDALKELSPSFVRFPGGCLAHGVGLDNVYDWKGSVGLREARRQLPNPWGYHQSRAIGYLEFFQLCELLDATPVPVVAAGVCCQNTPGGPRAVAIEDMPDYVQDVVDLVEFATGAPDSRWGALRAELGHPAPFELRYLGVGNEDEITGDFRQRYALIEDALHAAYPDVTVIGTSGPAAAGRDYDLAWEYARARKTRMLDEHYYDSPLWFHQNLHRYDAYDRTGPRVYLGEYAARSSTIRSALAEAAYMIGLERNSDVVRLASYAPLLSRVGHSQWQPDLIYFDSDAVMLTASYHVQRMFSRERGEQVHEVVAELGAGVPVRPLDRGEITLRARDARFRLSDIVVNDVPADAAELTQTDGLGLGEAGLDPLDLRFVAHRTDGARGLEIELGPDGERPAFTIELGTWKNECSSVKRRQFGISGDCGDLEFWRGFATGIDISVRVQIRDGRLRVWADDVLVHDVTPSTAPEERVVLGATSRTTANGLEHVVRLVNATDEVRPVSLRLEGRDIAAAHASLLTGARPEDGLFYEASPVSPAERDLEPENGVLDVDLQPWTFAVIVLTSTSQEANPEADA